MSSVDGNCHIMLQARKFITRKFSVTNNLLYLSIYFYWYEIFAKTDFCVGFTTNFTCSSSFKVQMHMQRKFVAVCTYVCICVGECVFVYVLCVCGYVCGWPCTRHSMFLSLSACDKNTTEEKIVWKDALVQYRENTDSLKKTVTLVRFPGWHVGQLGCTCAVQLGNTTKYVK